VSGQSLPQDPWSEFVRAVFDVNGLINKAGEAVARPQGQSAARWHVLGRAFESQTVAQMAANMGRAPQSVQRIADILDREGLIAYHAHPTDRRTKLAALTPRGHAVLAAIYERQQSWFASIVEQLSEAKLRRLTRGLNQVAQTLETRLAEHANP
jgi:DNA-binding MarR family transcriptional regulator